MGAHANHVICRDVTRETHVLKGRLTPTWKSFVSRIRYGQQRRMEAAVVTLKYDWGLLGSSDVDHCGGLHRPSISGL